MSSMIDTMITATTGAKAGLSTTNEGQVRKMLELLSAAVTRITMQQKQAREKILSEQRLHQRMEEHGEGVTEKKAAEAHQEIVSSPVPDVEYPVIVIDGFLGNEVSKSKMIYDLLVEVCDLLVEACMQEVSRAISNGNSVVGRVISRIPLGKNSVVPSDAITNAHICKRRLTSFSYRTTQLL